MIPTVAYAAAVDALAAARRRHREIRAACEHYQPSEVADSTGYPGCAESPPCPWSKQPRELWCETCAALEDVPRLGRLKNAKRAALREVLAAGRAGVDAGSITRTSIALVEARDEVKRLRAERAACICDFEERPDPANPWGGEYLDPLRTRGPEWDHTQTAGKKRVLAKTAPCWAVVESDDAPVTEYGKINQYEQIGDSDGFCLSCERRNVLHAAYRAARRRVVALTSGHLAATRAHMRRIGKLPPLVKPTPPAKPAPLAGHAPPARREDDPDDLPF